jgi:hypothetical protein
MKRYTNFPPSNQKHLRINEKEDHQSLTEQFLCSITIVLDPEDS